MLGAQQTFADFGIAVKLGKMENKFKICQVFPLLDPSGGKKKQIEKLWHDEKWDRAI